MKSASTVWRAIAVLALGGAWGCGGDLSKGGGYYGGYGTDGGGVCYANGAPVACGCVAEPYVVAADMSLTSGGSLADLRIRLLPTSVFGTVPSVSPPAAGTAAANDTWVATLLDGSGSALGSTLVTLPGSGVDGGSYASGGSYGQGYSGGYGANEAIFAIALTPGATTLRVASYASGRVLVDLDLRGHLQLLCIDHPCLAVCQSASAGMDGGTRSPVDGGVPGDVSGVLDGGARDAAPSPSDGGTTAAPDGAGRTTLDVSPLALDGPARTG